MSCKDGSCTNTLTSKTVTYEVEEEISREMERCYYEFNGLLQLLTQFTSTSPFKPDETRYNAILNEYMNRFIRYNLLFEEMTARAATDLEIDKRDIVDRSFNFYEKILYLNLKEE